MQTIDQFLNGMREKHRLSSDYGLAKHLGVRVQVISNYRNKRSLPDEVMASRIADELGLPRGYVLACIAAERASKAENPTLAETWRDVADKLGLYIMLSLKGAGKRGAGRTRKAQEPRTPTGTARASWMAPIAALTAGFKAREPV